MKTRFLILMAFLFVLSVRQINAQTCGYLIINNTNCRITVDVKWSDTAPSCPVCDAQFSLTVNANSSLPLTCSGSCGTICDVHVVVSGPFISNAVNSSNTTDSGSASTSCSPNGTYSVTWSSSSTTINP
jgi:hypothetical protein